MSKRRYLSLILTLVMLFAASLGSYAFAASAEEIASGAVFTPVTLEDGRKTVYISISVEDNTELTKIPVCCEVSRQLAKAQTDYADESFTLMSERRIVGELALHAIVYVMTDSFGGANADSPFHSYYESARIAELNIDESRIPSSTLEAVGGMYMLLNRMMGN